jgi:hypothetical protein
VQAPNRSRDLITFEGSEDKWLAISPAKTKQDAELFRKAAAIIGKGAKPNSIEARCAYALNNLAGQWEQPTEAENG